MRNQWEIIDESNEVCFNCGVTEYELDMEFELCRFGEEWQILCPECENSENLDRELNHDD